jgi:sugar lactone lactonase YvrE
VAVNSKGHIFVFSRGNTSGPAYAAAAAQLLEFSPSGKFVREIGKNLYAWSFAHSIAADAQGNIYVADRGNRRIQVFDGEGKLLRQITIDVPYDRNARPAIGNPINVDKLEASGGPLTMAPGSPWVLCITPGPRQVLYTSDAFPGRIYKLSLDGKVLGVLGESGKPLKQFGWIHGIACPSENVLYVGELLNWRVQKLILHPPKTGS